jgi:acetyl esterase
MFVRRCLLSVVLLSLWPLRAFEERPAPRLITYKSAAGVELKAHVFEPTLPSTGQRSAIVLFHGGGWNSGDGTWVYPSAQRFARLGMVAVAIDYRLSDEKSVTPLEAMEDARDALRWVRGQASVLRIDPKRIAAYGVSAGGHLAASAAMVPSGDAKVDPLSCPNALLLHSPAIAIANSGWARKLLLGRASPATISPDQFIRAGLPPTLISQGQEDIVTSFGGAVMFMRSMKAAGNECELRRYSGVGHLLTRNLDEQEWAFDPDPAARSDVYQAEAAFLAKLGFIGAQPSFPENPESTVRAFTEAFNARDLDGMGSRMAEEIVGIHLGGDQPQVDRKGRTAVRSSIEATLKRLPTLHKELHMLTTNGAYVSARERSTWKNEAGEEQRQNAMVMFEVVEGRIRKIWTFPTQN